MRTIILIAGLMAAAPAMAEQQQFDLVCRYGQTEVRYRVDLERGMACEDRCERVWRIGDVTAGQILLKDALSLDPGQVPQTIIVDRQTGALRHTIAGRYAETATCGAAPFSGFPATKF